MDVHVRAFAVLMIVFVCVKCMPLGKQKRTPQNFYPVLYQGQAKPFGAARPFPALNRPQIIPGRPGSFWLQYNPASYPQPIVSRPPVIGQQRFGAPKPVPAVPREFAWTQYNPAFGYPQSFRLPVIPQQRHNAPRPADKVPETAFMPFSHQLQPQPPAAPYYQPQPPAAPYYQPQSQLFTCDPSKLPIVAWQSATLNPDGAAPLQKEEQFLPKKKKQDFKSCLDYRLNGYCSNGGYTISDGKGEHYQVWCDFHSEPGFAWTLVMSHSLKNSNMTAFCQSSLSENVPVHTDSPNWDSYRLSKPRMLAIADQSSYWRATTGFPTYGNDFRDYVRGKFEDFDIIEFEGNGECKDVDYINIRGFRGLHTKAQFWQRKGKQSLHVDSAQGECPFKPSYGTIVGENNFGFYCEGPHTRNSYFRGTENEGSNTQWWFGGSMFDL